MCGIPGEVLVKPKAKKKRRDGGTKPGGTKPSPARSSQDELRTKSDTGSRATRAVGQTKTPPESKGMPGEGWERYTAPALIFLALLFLSITFSSPALFINDEWISVNQLHQLHEGTQLVVNEGKYGTYDDGTPGAYFKARNNLLGYTLMLPVLAYPAMMLVTLFGDLFRGFVLIIWAFIPVAMGLVAVYAYPHHSRWKNIPLIYFAIAGSALLLLINGLFYYPFELTGIDAPTEVAAVVFTNHFLFAILGAAVFLICRIAFDDDWYALFGTIMVISCSSFLFWASNAKDHILVVAMLAVTLLVLVRYFSDESYHNAALSFVMIGLLAWARPEVGFAVFIAAAAFYLILHLRRWHISGGDTKDLITSLTAPVWTIAGAFPFMINNQIVIGNPLIPSFYIYRNPDLAAPARQAASGPGADQGITEATYQVSAGADWGVSGMFEQAGGMILTGLTHTIFPIIMAPFSEMTGFFRMVRSYLAPDLQTLPADLFGVFIAPETGHISLIAVSPLILIALLIIPLLFWKKSEAFSLLDRKLIILFGAIGLAVMMVYLRSFHIMNTDVGIVPEMRYLTPLYLPAGLLALYAFRKTFPVSESKRLAILTLVTVLCLVPLLVLFIATGPFANRYFTTISFFSIMTYGILAIALLLLRTRASGKTKTYHLTGKSMLPPIVIALLAVFPLGWQLTMTFLYGTLKFDGYTFWIPLTEIIHEFLAFM